MSTNDKGSKSENKQVTLDSKKQSDKCQKDGKVGLLSIFGLFCVFFLTEINFLFAETP